MTCAVAVATRISYLPPHRSIVPFLFYAPTSLHPIQITLLYPVQSPYKSSHTIHFLHPLYLTRSGGIRGPCGPCPSMHRPAAAPPPLRPHPRPHSRRIR